MIVNDLIDKKSNTENFVSDFRQPIISSVRSTEIIVNNNSKLLLVKTCGQSI